jgi:hypothetical protein
MKSYIFTQPTARELIVIALEAMMEEAARTGQIVMEEF